MSEINIEKIKVPVQQEDAVTAAALAFAPQWVVFAIFVADFQRVVKQAMECLVLEADRKVSDRSMEILEEQIQSHQKAHRQLEKIKRHRESPGALSKNSKKV